MRAVSDVMVLTLSASGTALNKNSPPIHHFIYAALKLYAGGSR
jgi:hypothetical protein